MWDGADATRREDARIDIDASDAVEKQDGNVLLDTSGIEPDTSRMLSERDKPTTPCAHVSLALSFGLKHRNPSFAPDANPTFDEHREHIIRIGDHTSV